MTRLPVILLALILDLTLGDPPNRYHPVVLMGNWLTAGRRLAPSRHRFWFGAGWIVAGIAIFALPWRKLGTDDGRRTTDDGQQHQYQPLYLLRLLASAILLKSVFAYRNLRRTATEVGQALTRANLSEARRLVAWHLVSRDTSQLTTEEVASAAIESLAENITDSLVAPLLAYTAGGLPAAWAYRFVNTADTMWGYRTTEFEQLGKFPARLDDLLNWFPARLTGWLLVAAAWLAGENAGRAARVMLAQHGRTSSPNAGWTMSAMAGALGITLSKHDAYDLTGGPKTAGATAIRRALRVADICASLVIVVLCLSLIAPSIRPKA